MRAERLTDSIAYHGEGPVWWPRLGAVRMVDLLAGDVLTVGADAMVVRTHIGSPVAAVVRPRHTAGAVVARERDIVLFADDALGEICWRSGLFVPDGQRANEGGCDPQGRFLVGTMAYDRRDGVAHLYRLDPGAAPDDVTLVRGGLTIANGLAWSPDGRTAYHADTPTRCVFAIDHDPVAGLGPRRVFARLDEAWPDGLTVDAEGGIWVALNGAGRVVRLDPGTTQITEVVTVTPRQSTACTFGGPNLDILYITTSRENLPADADPAAGSLYAVTPGVRGLPPLPFGG
ncbi:MAG: SMP-30/gluconolactonase/LRE family protein [Tetrasphaera sp.]|jgi:sugar lactone lactonase YvrE|nr:SMP-30/gluconolactonase/LRE family protein [Tetrasphaera sp.]